MSKRRRILDDVTQFADAVERTSEPARMVASTVQRTTIAVTAIAAVMFVVIVGLIVLAVT